MRPSCAALCTWGKADSCAPSPRFMGAPIGRQSSCRDELERPRPQPLGDTVSGSCQVGAQPGRGRPLGGAARVG